VSDAYPQLLRTPRRAWWKPIVGLCVAVFTLIVSSVAIVFGIGGVGALLGVDDPFSDNALSPDVPLGLLATNLSIAMILPSVLVAVLLVHRERPAWLASVVGRMRWALLARFFGIALALAVVFFVLTFAVPPAGIGDLHPPSASRLSGLLVVITLTTPLQSAGEEFGFRGYLTQAICSWLNRPEVAAVVAGLITAGLFALAHGTQDPWLFSDRLAFGLVASWLAWRTGGLEASIALHAANNLVSLGYSAVEGTLSESLNASSVDWQYVVLDVAMMLVFAAMARRLADRWQLTVRRVAPALDVQPPAAGPGVLSGPPAVGYPEPRSDSSSYGVQSEVPRED
jgi:membrane protease YdiL (CAAX protease family)